jgi:hypothetical protein
MTQQIGYFVAASCSIVTLLRPCTLGSTGFQALLLLRQNKKYKGFSILACFARLEVSAKPDGKSGRVSGDSMNNFHVAI